MSLENEVVIVSGLPRSGTSLMMQMLDRGGIPAVTDQVRISDRDNPKGYFEFEPVKSTKKDPSWLPDARGKCVKMVSSLLYDLPASETYRIVFMQRDLDEVLASQEAMLRRLNRPCAPTDQMKASFQVHLKKLFEWLPQQTQMHVHVVNYNRLISDPETECTQINGFLSGILSMEAMISAIDSTLYRNRK